ncbi:MAG: hypothetical protein QNJ72_03750 [Pleurocapsa sp. MO_226.B13]|nr:hypothetical protein [Pleurocapsa sp. MO_226.B13]
MAAIRKLVDTVLVLVVDLTDGSSEKAIALEFINFLSKRSPSFLSTFCNFRLGQKYLSIS